MNPKDWTLLQWIGVVLVVNGALTGYVNEMTDLVGAVWAKHIVSLCTIGSGVCGGLVTMFGGIGTQARNVVSAGGQINVSPHAADALTALAQDSTQPAVRAVAKILIAAFAVSLVFLAGMPGAEAQTKRIPRSTTGVLCDPAGLLPGCPKPSASDSDNANGSSKSSNPILNALSKPFQDLANFIANDADGAATLATQIPQLQDVNGKACWVKMQAAGAVFKAHPVPLTFQVMTDFEAFRLLQMTANDLCTYTPCTVVFSDTANLVTSVASAVGGALTSAMTPQSLTQLCSRIPQLAPQLPQAVTGIAPAPAVQGSAPAVAPIAAPSAVPTTSPSPNP